MYKQKRMQMRSSEDSHRRMTNADFKIVFLKIIIRQASPLSREL